MSKIAVVGKGNVGTHLANELSKSHQVDVFSRAPNDETYDLDSIRPSDFEFIFLTVPDAAIKSMAKKLDPSDAIILHTSGSRPLADLEGHQKIGVLYPLQTFSREKHVEWKQVQLFVEGISETEEELVTLGKSLSGHVKTLSSTSRAQLHLAAVFACNFSNHMFQVAERLLSKLDMDFKDILPLVNETIEKAATLDPSNSQTGPAVRKDEITINHHLEMLEDDDRLIYELITRNIQKYN